MRNILIGIDGNEANVEKRVGISEYAFELLKQFSQFSIFSPRSEAGNFQFSIYLKNKPRSDLPQESENWRYRVVGPQKLWTQVGLPFDLYFHKSRPEVFFSPTHYAPRFSPVPVVISIMDLSYIHFPQMFKKSDLYQLRNWTAYSVKKAKKIFTISQASKDDIIKEYGAVPEKVVVTYPGIKLKTPIRQAQGKQNFNMDKLRKKYGISGEYVLFVGTLQPRKNLVRLIEAFAQILRNKDTKILSGNKQKAPNILISQYPNLSLVIVGKKGWLYEEILAAPKKFGVADRVKFLDFVPDEDMSTLYKNAICFVLPSLYEGFGLPVLEAMSNGCPVITSNISSLPEAGGDAALFVDPENVDDIAKNLELIINPSADGSELRKKMMEKGYKQAKKFSWEKTARETLKVLTKVVYER